MPTEAALSSEPQVDNSQPDPFRPAPQGESADAGEVQVDITQPEGTLETREKEVVLRANIGLQARLFMGVEALDPNKTDLDPLSPETLKLDHEGEPERLYATVNRTSDAERRNYWRNEGITDFERQKETWRKEVKSIFTNNKDFFATPGGKGESWNVLYKKLKFDATNFTEEDAKNIYAKYFDEATGKSRIEDFVRDILDQYVLDDKKIDIERLQQDMEGILWLGKIFGNNSSEIITDLVDTCRIDYDEKTLAVFTDKVNERSDNNGTLRINNLTDREKELLNLLWENRPQEPAQTQPLTPPASPDTDTGQQKEQEMKYPENIDEYKQQCANLLQELKLPIELDKFMSDNKYGETSLSQILGQIRSEQIHIVGGPEEEEIWISGVINLDLTEHKLKVLYPLLTNIKFFREHAEEKAKLLDWQQQMRNIGIVVQLGIDIDTPQAFHPLTIQVKGVTRKAVVINLSALPDEIVREQEAFQLANNPPTQPIAPQTPDATPSAGFQPGQATWKNKNYDQPVEVIGFAGKGPDGRDYVFIKGSNTAVPVDELIYATAEPDKQETSPLPYVQDTELQKSTHEALLKSQQELQVLQRNGEVQISPGFLTAGKFLWQHVTYGDSLQKHSDDLYRGYAMIEPEDMPKALDILMHIGEQRKAEGKNTDFKWLVMTYPKHGNAADMAQYVSNPDNVGQYNELTSTDPRIAVYADEQSEIQEILRTLAETPEWKEIEVNRIKRNGGKPENTPRRPGTNAFTHNGREYRSLNYNNQPGYSESEAADPNWRDNKTGSKTVLLSGI